MLLQAVAFSPLFRDLLGGDRCGPWIDTFESSECGENSGSAFSPRLVQQCLGVAKVL